MIDTSKNPNVKIITKELEGIFPQPTGRTIYEAVDFGVLVESARPVTALDLQVHIRTIVPASGSVFEIPQRIVFYPYGVQNAHCGLGTVSETFKLFSEPWFLALRSGSTIPPLIMAVFARFTYI